LEHRDRDIRIFRRIMHALGGPEVSQASPGRLALEIG